MNLSKLKKYKFTKSPYIFYDDGMPSMYFTVYLNGIWNLYFTDNKEVQKVDFLQDMSIENVTCYKDPQTGIYCVSFCSKMGELNSLFYTETTNPTLFKVFISLASNCRTGVVTPHRIIVVNLDNHILIYDRSNLDLMDCKFDNNGLIKELVFDFKNITNISFTNGDLNQILISYQDLQVSERCGTILFNLVDNSIQKQLITDKNLPISEATIDPFTNEVLYSKHTGLRKIHKKITKTYLKNIVSKNISLVK